MAKIDTQSQSGGGARHRRTGSTHAPRGTRRLIKPGNENKDTSGATRAHSRASTRTETRAEAARKSIAEVKKSASDRTKKARRKIKRVAGSVRAGLSDARLSMAAAARRLGKRAKLWPAALRRLTVKALRKLLEAPLTIFAALGSIARGTVGMSALVVCSMFHALGSTLRDIAAIVSFLIIAPFQFANVVVHWAGNLRTLVLRFMAKNKSSVVKRGRGRPRKVLPGSHLTFAPATRKMIAVRRSPSRKS